VQKVALPEQLLHLEMLESQGEQIGFEALVALP
jgi:hypothetical protein